MGIDLVCLRSSIGLLDEMSLNSGRVDLRQVNFKSRDPRFDLLSEGQVGR